MTAAADCAARIRALYGTDLEAPRGTLHVAAVGREAEGGLPTLRITAQTPRSATDRFVLGLARARADAVLTTGQILRDEPALEHRYHEDEAIDAALAAWRSERIGKPAPPVSVVLTSGRALDSAHPLFAGPAPVWILTTETAAATLRGLRLAERHRVVGASDLTPRRALAYLRGEVGFETVSVEAGASTTEALYRGTAQVDELWLSVFDSGGLPESLRGPAFASASRLLEIFGPPRSRHVEEEPSGRWSFSRFR